MRHKWKLGTYFGIDVYLHWSFFLLLAWVLLSGGGVVDALVGALFLAAIFACVVAHEYGHALMARSFGIGTNDITLYPIGGIASLRAMPKKPREEIAVALAGPAVNIVLAFFLALFLLVTGQWTASSNSLESGVLSFGGFLMVVLVANVILAGFNLIPAFPMDGGRVLRAWLARKHDYATATHKAATVGRVFAVLFAIIALVKGLPLFLFLAAFIYFMAGVERRHAYLERDLDAFRWSHDRFNQGSRRIEDDDVIEVEVISSPRSR